MQYPVPQFTDVEDRIIGPLTVKQFGIVFAGGVFVFLFYSATKSIAVLIGALLVFGLPALVIAFGKINGRPMYNTFSVIFRYLTSDKSLVFHREVNSLPAKVAVVTQEIKTAPPVTDAEAKLLEINAALERQEQQEKELIRKI